MQICAAVLMCLAAGCTSRQGEGLTPQQKAQIEGEVKAVDDSILATWVRLDVDATMRYYAPEVVVAEGAERMDFQAYKKAWGDFNKASASLTVAPTRHDCVVVSKDLAIATWVGAATLVQRSGDTLLMNPLVYSNVAKKIAGRWLLIYSNPSASVVVHKASRARRP